MYPAGELAVLRQLLFAFEGIWYIGLYKQMFA